MSSLTRAGHHCVLPVSEISHNNILPRSLQKNIPKAECLILSFLLSYLESKSIDAPILIVGGYVRDLLLGKEPDDLDLALCLAECSEDNSVSSLVAGMPAFALKHPELCVVEIRVTTILSDVAKAKQLDTAKCNFDLLVDKTTAAVKRVEVDIMPTIGEETYDEHNRIPIRNERGTIFEDTLRRDLTIGALLLSVERNGGERMKSGDGESGQQSGQSGKLGQQAERGEQEEELTMRILDHHGGVIDLDAGVLRSPIPASDSMSLKQVQSSILENVEDNSLGKRLCIHDDNQSLWWIKVLRDDPLRILRCLRFASKFQFNIHASFWLSVPFSEDVLRNKVSGNRKLTEMLKIAKVPGHRGLPSFLTTAFGRRYITYGGEERSLAPALLGGVPLTKPPTSGCVDENGVLTVPNILNFDEQRFHEICTVLIQLEEDMRVRDQRGCSIDERLGLYLAAAMDCSTFASNGGGRGGGGGDELLTPSLPDLFECCCVGLSSSKATRVAGVDALQCYVELLSHLSTKEGGRMSSSLDGMEDLVSTFVPFSGVDLFSFRLYLLLFKHGISKTGKQGNVDCLRQLKMEVVMSLLETSDVGGVSSVRSSYDAILASTGSTPPVTGQALGGIQFLPRHLYGTVLSCINVIVSLRGGWNVETKKGGGGGGGGGGSTLLSWLEDHASGLLDCLEGELYELMDEKRLKEKYLLKKKGKKGKKQQKKRRVE